MILSVLKAVSSGIWRDLGCAVQDYWTWMLVPKAQEGDTYRSKLLLKFCLIISVACVVSITGHGLLDTLWSFDAFFTVVSLATFLSLYLVLKFTHFQTGARIVFVFALIFIMYASNFRKLVYKPEIQMPLSSELSLLVFPAYMAFVLLRGWSMIIAQLSIAVQGLLLLAFPCEDVGGEEFIIISTFLTLICIMWQQHYLVLEYEEQMKGSIEYLQKMHSEIHKDLVDRNTFLFNMSHEIRNPLNGIVGSLEAIEDGAGGVDDDIDSHLQTIKLCSANLLHIVNNVLDWGKASASHITLERVPLSIRTVLNQAVGATKYAIADKNIHLKVECEDVEVKGDPTKIQQILVNLLSNCFKFTAHGQVLVRGFSTQDSSLLHELPLPAKKVAVVFELTDSGIGMSPEQRGKLFLPFSQVSKESTGKTSEKGSGLGLSIVKMFSELMQGSVFVEAGPNGVGSVFTVILMLDPIGKNSSGPLSGIDIEGALRKQKALTERNDSRDATLSHHSSGIGGMVHVAQLRVLVVDDSAINRKVMLHLLKALGAKVTLACDGVEAVKACAMQAFDLILMDLDMPNMSGGQACAVIRRGEGPCTGTPIVALTGATTVRPEGMQSIVLKPVNKKVVRSLLEEFCGTCSA